MPTRLAAMTLLMLAFGAAPTAWAASMWSGWTESHVPLEQCQQIASGRIRELGFNPNASGSSTFGWRGNDGITVRCIPERQMAVIFVYSTNDEEGRRILDQMRAAFQPAGTPSAPTQQRRSGGASKF
jgi:CubicO group peptidase (beta-lactamase class C family)